MLLPPLRDYQTRGVQLGVKTLNERKRLCFAAPMGTGKSIVELAIQQQVPGAWIITPRVEIIRGMIEKMGEDPSEWSEAKLIEFAWSRCITTPVRMRNALLEGRMLPLPTALIIDEGHHIEADTYQQIMLCCGDVGILLLTASPYRGTPGGTKSFREAWGEPEWLLTFDDAIKQGYMSLPSMTTVPLVDDDVIEIVNGELQISGIESATRSRLHDVANLLSKFYDPTERKWDKPTIVSLPTTQLCWELFEVLVARQMTAAMVTQSTSFNDRKEAFKATLAGAVVLLQINVVSEGVDLPLRRLVDCSPTMSPVRWVQQVGRITRPGGECEYVCTNRNLMRHYYTFDGTLPPAPLAQAQEAFGGVGKRSGIRVIGLEALGRLKPATVLLDGGVEVTTYAVSAGDNGKFVKYFVILHPRFALPIWAKRVDSRDAKGAMLYGKWEAASPPSELKGFASLPAQAITEKQLAWWARSGKNFGLDASIIPNKKTFQILPVLKDLRIKLGS